MTTKLELYNGALDVLGERKLVTLTENRKARRDIDAVYAAAIKFCLQSASWNHATREVMIQADPDYEPDFGFSGVFDKPEDWVSTQAISANDNFQPSLTAAQYSDQTAFFYADLEALYLRYISDDAAYGGDLTLWPESFCTYVHHYIAWRTCRAITGDNALKATVKTDMDKLKWHAQSLDNQNEGTKFPPRGTWSNARTRGRSTYGERAP